MHICGAAVAYTMLDLPSCIHELGVLGKASDTLQVMGSAMLWAAYVAYLNWVTLEPRAGA
jgi:hypothetical protein